MVSDDSCLSSVSQPTLKGLIPDALRLNEKKNHSSHNKERHFNFFCLWKKQNFRKSSGTKGRAHTLDMENVSCFLPLKWKWWEVKGFQGLKQDLSWKCGLLKLCFHINCLSFMLFCCQMLLFNHSAGGHIDQQGVTVIKTTVLQLKDQTAGVCISLDFCLTDKKSKKHHILRVWGFVRANTAELLTESDDGQDDGDPDGHPGHPQSFLAVTLCFMRLQTHAAFQKTCRRQRRARWPTRYRYDSETFDTLTQSFLLLSSVSTVNKFIYLYYETPNWWALNWLRLYVWPQHNNLKTRDYLHTGDINCNLLLTDN